MIPHDIFARVTDELLRDVVRELKKSNELAEKNNRLLELLIFLGITQPKATGLSITQENPMQQFDPSATGIVLQAAFTPAGSTAPNAGFSVAWSDSNNFCTFANDASDATGLTQDVTVSAAAVVGATGVITATLTGTFPDGTAASLTGTFSYTIGAAPVANATGLGITQIA